jgi:aminoglycoside phosphotransferase (APT) family kinase protein
VSGLEPGDCTLTPEAVARLVARTGVLDGGGVRYLGEGSDSWVYATHDGAGARWLVRFPKRAQVAVCLERELVLLPELARLLPLAVPRFELVGDPGEGYPHRFAAYRCLPGAPALDTLEEEHDVGPLGEALGGFLAVLHGFPAERAATLGIGADDDQPAEIEAAHARGLIERHAGLGEADLARVDEALARPGPPAAEAVLVHTDFYPEHLLVEAGAVVGVIDWSDVALGDPAVDLAGLWYWLGEPLLQAGLRTYARLRRLDADTAAGLAARARFAAVCRAGADLEFGARHRRTAFTRMALRALHRASRGREG